MATIDLDALRAARREGKGEAPTFAFGGKTFTLPAEMPFAVVEIAGDGVTTGGDVAAMLRGLVGEKQWADFIKLGPSMEDITELFTALAGVYGVTVGESPASDASSGSISRRPRRTSKATTGSD